MKRIFSIFLALCMCLTGIPIVFAAETASTPAVDTAEPSADSYVPGSLLFALQSPEALDSITDALTAFGVIRVEPLFTENGKAVSLGERKEIWYSAQISGDVLSATAAVSELDGVICAEPEYVYTTGSYNEPTEIECSRDWAYKKLHKHENQYWWKDHFHHTDKAPGYGTVVAVIDTGVDFTHKDLVSNMWINYAELSGIPGVDDDGNGYIDDIYGADVTASGTKSGNPMDDNGHGTHVAGIVAMAANNDGGVGLAYGAKIMAVKAGQSTGTFASSDIAKAILYAHMMGADVINMSFGGTGKSYLVESALENAFADCVLVASAGNDGLPTTDADPSLYPKRADIYPAAYSYVIGVMATDSAGNLAGFSNWDYFPGANAEYELTAPGVGIYSTLPGNRYAEWNGTSMAAPFVSAAAAILRSHYSDKAMYSSRFIMGQLASATEDRTAFTAPQKDRSYSYPALNVFDSMTKLPKPNLTVKDTFLMDNVNAAFPLNDGDAIIDAGETVDLGVLVRNQWGLTGTITVKADAVSAGGVANPWITFLTDTVTLQPAGTFEEVNNGFVYNDSYLEAVGNPIRFVVAQNTPNDTEICINLTVTTTNGADVTDTAVYTVKADNTFRVQAGRSIRGTLTQDTTLTNDYLWIVENALLIPEGITLTIEPGTKVQFWSSDYENAYGQKSVVYIDCEGTLNAIGTEKEPIEMFPGKGFEQYGVIIYGTGEEMLQYCTIVNPIVNKPEHGDTNNNITSVDHCTLIQNYSDVLFRRVTAGQVQEQCSYYYFHIASVTNTKMYNLDFGNIYSTSTLHTSNIQNCLLDNCRVTFDAIDKSFISRNNVISGTPNDSSADFGEWLDIPANTDSLVYPQYMSTSRTYEGASSKYVKVNLAYEYSLLNYYYSYLSAAARSIGGSIASVNDTAEEEFIRSAEVVDSWRVYNQSGFAFGSKPIIGYRYNIAADCYEWDDGSTYNLELQTNYNDEVYSYVYVESSGLSQKTGISGSSDSFLLEFPAELSDETIHAALQNYSFETWILENIAYKQVTNNSFLNPVLNNNTDTWAKMKANDYNASNLPNYAQNNYWGTENQNLIDLMITDADDFPGTYQDIIHDPILTLESPSLSEIYPFVTQVYLKDRDGNITQNVQPGQPYSVHVHFNRDMDMTEQPTVTYGGDTPYTDYAVSGAFVSPREWVGTTTISPVMNSGTMYFRTVGGRAADDHWLVCGEDVLRFSFNVSSIGALAMMLNAQGGTNKVLLSWAQNDYDVLAGYNLYRSTSPDSGFEKLNVSVLTGTEYEDTDVEPGVMYYYYFKVVNTEGNEEEGVSNTASAAPRDNISPVLKHTPVAKAKMNTSITISATATDNIAIEAVKLFYRKAGDTVFSSQTMLNAADSLFVSSIPASAVTALGVEYYVIASDADGNVTHSGTAQIPHMIEVNSAPYISGVTPSRVSIAGGQTVTILGGNFTEGIKLTIGGTEVTALSVPDAGQITFTAPAMASGSYALVLTTADGLTVTSTKPLAYSDDSSIAQIPTDMTMLSGTPYTFPFYATAAGTVTSVHVELDLPSSYFSQVSVAKADEEAPFTMEYSCINGILKIGCVGSSNTIASDTPLLNITVTPQATQEITQAITLHDVQFNGVDVSTVISGTALLKPIYTINAEVKYFNDEKIEGATVSADKQSAATDEDGKAVLHVGERDVRVTVSHQAPVNAFTAYDAHLVLKHSVGLDTLNEYALLAADVNGDGSVNEYDASLILQRSSRKISAFPAGITWIFVPAYADLTLTTSTNTITFIAIALGDVDGSYSGGGGSQ